MKFLDQIQARVKLKRMENLHTFSDLWPVFLSLLGLTVWAVRLEGRVNQGERDHQATLETVKVLGAKHDALDSKVVEQLASVRESLARIEGALGVGTHNNLGG